MSTRPAPPTGTKQLLDELGPEGIRRLDARRRSACCVTDTTMRDAPPVAARHPHAHATTSSRIAGAYARALPQLFSLECWGGATFDVAMRFLHGGPVGAAAR